MQLASLRKSMFVAAVVLALLPVLPSAPATDAAKDTTVPSPTEVVRDKLEQSIAGFNAPAEWTLKDALDYLGDHYHLTFVVDNRAFNNEGFKDVGGACIAPGEGWTLKDVKLKEVVRALLGKVQLPDVTYVIIGNTIVITTAEGAPYLWLHQLVTVDCQKEPMSAVLKKLAHETGTNLVLDPRAAKEAETAVTMQVHDVTLERAVSLVAEMADLKPLRLGNVLFLTTKASAVDMRADKERAALISPFPLPDMKKVQPMP